MNNKNFDIELLFKKENNKKKREKDIYKLILKKCINHILFSANNNKKECTYLIPLFLYGKPLYDINECNDVYQNNVKEFESIIKQYADITKIMNQLLDRIICKLMMNEEYIKINILINELNRLLSQYYLPYIIQIDSPIQDSIKANIINSSKIEYTSILCKLTQSSYNKINIELNYNSIIENYEVDIGEKFIFNDFLELTILKNINSTISIDISKNELLILMENNSLQTLELSITNLQEIKLLNNNYLQFDNVEAITNIKNQLECYSQYLIEKLDIICSSKKRYHQIHSNNLNTYHIHSHHKL